MTRLRSLAAMMVLSAIPLTPAAATFHFMQIEQVVGGFEGDTSAQAIQLRMRSIGQEFVEFSQIRVWDSTGSNPILIAAPPSSVPIGDEGSRVLFTSAAFDALTTPEAVNDFPMLALIPDSYIAAGSMTFEDSGGTVVYWRLSWGGGSYIGSTTGSITNDDDGDFGPPWPGPLPTADDLKGLLFQGPASAISTTNEADYALTDGPAVFTNNAGDSFTLGSVSVGEGGAGPVLGARSYPNPFRASTRVAFTLPSAGGVELHLTDASGRSVRVLGGTFGEGPREFLWDGRNSSGSLVPPGVYFYELQTDAVREGGRVLVLR